MVKWENITIGELLEFKNGLNKGKEFFGQGTPIVNYMDVYRYRGLRANQLRGRVTLSAEEIKRFDVQKGDVFFTRTSETPEEVGYASVMFDEIDDCVFSGFVLRGRPITDKLDIGYCQYAFMTDDVRKAIMSGCTYTTRALTNGKQLSAIEIELPEKPEQHRIAAALSDADAFIAALEKLIAKKRAVKQGAMQELLTGKRRLPGFSGEWVERTIDYYGTFTSGNGFPLAYQGEKSGDFPFFKVSDFSNVGNEYVMCRANHYISSAVANILSCNIIPKTSIIFAKIGAAIFLERKRQNDRDCCIDNNMMAYTVNVEGDSKYLLYLFQTLKFGDIVTATALPSLSGKQVGAIIRDFPPTHAEQTAIAEILSNMDAEIDTLTMKLTKARHIKQGMMSELLTGRIRLEEDTDNGEN
jgi:type I restriction enzyme S subunit